MTPPVNAPCRVTSTGAVTCRPHMTFWGLCTSNYKRWPYDVQNCTLTFGTWMQKGEEVSFQLADTFSVSHAPIYFFPWPLGQTLPPRGPSNHSSDTRNTEDRACWIQHYAASADSGLHPKLQPELHCSWTFKTTKSDEMMIDGIWWL